MHAHTHTRRHTHTQVVDALTLLRPPHRASRPKRILVVLRGLPGSGKSFLAKKMRDVEVEEGGEPPRVHAIDDYFIAVCLCVRPITCVRVYVWVCTCVYVCMHACVAKLCVQMPITTLEGWRFLGLRTCELLSRMCLAHLCLFAQSLTTLVAWF